MVIPGFDGDQMMCRSFRIGLVLLALVPLTATAQPSAVNVLVHGVNSGPAEFQRFVKDISPQGNTWTLQFNWGKEPILKASDQVGARPNSATGMSDRAWGAVGKLKDVVARCREIVGANAKINLVSHSQGSVISLAALQEGMSVDNWLIMGSPLDNDAIVNGRGNTHLVKGIAQVSGDVFHFWSPDDRVARLKGGIGSRGLPTRRKFYSAKTRMKNGRYKNLSDLKLTGVDHSGSSGWWSMGWLKDDKQWGKRAQIRPIVLSRLLNASKGTPAARIPPAFKKLQSAALLGPGKWDSVRDQRKQTFSHTFVLTKDMQNGVYFDDKTEATLAVKVLSGTAQIQIRSATWSSYDKYSLIYELKDRQSLSRSFVPARPALDATIEVVIKAVSSGITKVEIDFAAER